MARTVNVHEAKTHLSRLLEAVENGEEVVIARAGKPVAKLVRLTPAPAQRRAGAWKGLVADDFLDRFDELDEEIADSFYDSTVFPG